MTTLNRCFGIEIEVKGNSSVHGVRELLESNGVTNWSVAFDGSVDDGVEVVSPKLSGEDGIEDMRKVVGILRANGHYVDEQCGLHVHVDGAGLSGYTLANIVKRYAAFEQTTDSWMTPDRRESNNRYTGSCNPLVNLITATESCNDTARSIDNRYRKVNITAFLRHGTVEFRHHYGTINAEEIENWVRFCVGFVNSSVCTTRIVRTKGNGSLRSNAVEKKFVRLIRAFLASPRFRLTTEKAAAVFECSDEQVPVYMSRFRSWLGPSYEWVVMTRRGVGYDLSMMRGSSAHTHFVELSNHPGVEVVETVIDFTEPGLFAGMPSEVEAYYKDRAMGNEILESFRSAESAIAA